MSAKHEIVIRKLLALIPQENQKAAFEELKILDSPLSIRREEQRAKTKEKRDSTIFYLYKMKKGNMYQTTKDGKIADGIKVVGIDQVCKKLKIREAYLHSHLSGNRERGYAAFGSGANKYTISREPLTINPRDDFDNKFFFKHGSWPTDDDYPNHLSSDYGEKSIGGRQYVKKY